MKKSILFYILSILIYIVSLTMPIYSTAGFEDVENYWEGAYLLLIGIFGVFIGVYAWLANPLFLGVAIIFWTTDYRKRMLFFSVLAILLSLSFLLNDTILVNEAGHYKAIAERRCGYWLWVSSMVLMAVANYLRMIEAKQSSK